MNFLPVLFVMIAVAHANPIQYVPYAFGYSTADGISRQEQGSNGVVIGSYSYTDANGDFRQVKYTADSNGYRPEGDIGVDRRTAIAAAELAAQAPKPVPAPYSAPAAYTAPAYQAVAQAAPRTPPAHVPAFTSFSNFPSHNAQLISASHASTLGYQVDTPTHKIWVRY